ncbi:nitroreductase family protein [Paenibacillus sp. MBLB4367]|uniref:nitroreductase family protein n=1 Tax=Paenibacillus sp. MBLB4367 TaxID=3384767 RepID=UPI0039084341
MASAAQTTLMTVEEAMRSRHSVRKYEAGFTIPEKELTAILEQAANAPSSWNLQHWRFLVIAEQRNKDRLLAIANNQRQVSECSAVIVMLGDLQANLSAEAVYRPALEAGAFPKQAYDTLLANIEQAYAAGGQTPRDEAMLNTGLAAMQVMLAAKAKGYDTCPMGGFNRPMLIEAFQIPQRYVPVMMITVGKQAAAAHPTVRFPIEQLIVRESF